MGGNESEVRVRLSRSLIRKSVPIDTRKLTRIYWIKDLPYGAFLVSILVMDSVTNSVWRKRDIYLEL